MMDIDMKSEEQNHKNNNYICNKTYMNLLVDEEKVKFGDRCPIGF